MKTNKMTNLIYEGTLKFARIYGIANISTRKLAKELKISEGTIFHYFNSKQNLIDECAIEYDRNLIKLCKELIKKKYNMSDLWNFFFNHLLENIDGTVFYFDYVNYYGFDPTDKNTRALEFLEISKELFKDKTNLNDLELLLLWDYVSTQLFYYTGKIIDGYLDNNDEIKEYIKNLVFNGYKNV